MQAGSLAGLRVVEMGNFIAGPFCGQLLADHGADVVKIEPPRTGDAMRQWGAVRAAGQSLWWPVIGRNKRSVTLDLRNPKGAEIAKRLILGADIVVENFRPGTLERWGLDPQLLLAENPRLIIARVSGFGQTGPDAKKTGFGAIAEAVGGLRHLGGFPDMPPPRIGLSIGDSLAGLMAMIGVLTALNARHTDGMGQVVDVAIADSVLSVMESVISEYGTTGAIRQPTGTTLPRIAPSNLYPTVDGRWCLIAANADPIFRRLTQAMRRPQLADDPRYATHHRRGENQAELDDIIAAWTRSFVLEELLDLLQEHSVPASVVADAAAVAANPHFRERGSIIEVHSADLGAVTMQGVVPRLSRTPGAVRWAGPALGAHTQEVLEGELEIRDAELQTIHAEAIT